MKIINNNFNKFVRCLVYLQLHFGLKDSSGKELLIHSVLYYMECMVIDVVLFEEGFVCSQQSLIFNQLEFNDIHFSTMCALISYQLLIATPTKLSLNFKLGESTFLNFTIVSSYPFIRFDSSIFVLYYPSFSFFYQFQIVPFMKKLFCGANLSNVLLQPLRL